MEEILITVDDVLIAGTCADGLVEFLAKHDLQVYVYDYREIVKHLDEFHSRYVEKAAGVNQRQTFGSIWGSNGMSELGRRNGNGVDLFESKAVGSDCSEIKIKINEYGCPEKNGDGCSYYRTDQWQRKN